MLFLALGNYRILMQYRAFHSPATDAAIGISFVNRPIIKRLGQDVIATRFLLILQRIEFQLQTFFSRFANINRAINFGHFLPLC
jgi:hypothetical protein